MINQIPNDFKEKYTKILGDEFSLFIDSYKEKPLKTIRINTIKFKKNIDDLEYFKENNITYEKINFLKNTFTISSEVFGLGNTIEQLLGFFQMQEVSSIIPVFILDPNPSDIVLDMTAAPGNKSSLISELMNNKGLLVANDLDKKRSKKLVYTLKKLGVTNTIVTCQDALKFNIDNLLFDKILLDAPCSCEGFFLKKSKGFETWSQKLVVSKSILQKKLIKKAVDLLKPNGVLVYSTCTLSPEENEEVIDFIIKDNRIIVEEINIPELNIDVGLTKYGSKQYDESIKNTIRIYPHKTNLEGFFICKLRKKKEHV